MAVALGTEPFISVVRRVAGGRGDAPAVDELTYTQLWDQTGRVAKRLVERGVVAGDRVAIYSENRRGFVLAYLALLRIGAIAVPTNVLYRAADLGNILSDAKPRLVVGSSQTRPHVPAETPFVDAAEVEAWATDMSLAPAFADAAVEPNDVAIMIYTSGTTGRAKGALITHGNLAAIAAQVGEAWHWTNRDTLLITLPLFHVHGLCAGLNGTLAAGAHAIVRERFDVNEVVELLQSGKITMFFGVPTMYVRFNEKIPAQKFPHVRLFVSGSAALPADVHQLFEEKFGASILERYGSTEFGFPLGNRYEGPRIVGSVGVPMPGVEVTIVAPHTADAVAPGEVGELLVYGPNVCRGYWDRPEAMADAFVEIDGKQWFRSGDSVRFDPDTKVYVIMGRLKELIISGGFNVYPLEVEAEMRLQPGVRDVALVGMPDPARGEIPVAFVEADPGFDSEAFVAALRERLASFKLPKAVRVVDALPRNAMGKVEKQKLKTSAEGIIVTTDAKPSDYELAVREYQASRARYIRTVMADSEKKIGDAVAKRRDPIKEELNNLTALARVRFEARQQTLRAYQQKAPGRVGAGGLLPPSPAERMVAGIDKIYKAAVKAAEEFNEINEIMKKRKTKLDEIETEARTVLEQHGRDLIGQLETETGLEGAFKRDPLLGRAHARMMEAEARRTAVQDSTPPHAEVPAE